MSRLSKNIIYNCLGQGVILILGFLAVKYIFKQLGEDALGLIYFTSVMNSVLCAILEMGICSTSIREISTHLHSDYSYVRNLIRTFSLFYWSAYILIVTAIFFLAPEIVDRWLTLKTMNSTTAIYVLRILGITSLLALPKSFYISLFRGLQRMEFNNLLEVTTNGLQQSGTFLILMFGGDLFHVVYWISACYCLNIICYFAFSIRFFNFCTLIPGYFHSVVKRNLKFASKMMAITILSGVHTQADKLIISKLFPISAIAYYGIAYSFVSKGSLITGAIAQASFPSFSALLKEGNRKALMSQYNDLQDLVCYGIVPIFAAIPFISDPLFSYILDPQAAKLLFWPTALLCLGFYMNGTITIPYIFSLASGKPEITARMNFIGLFVILPITVILIYLFGFVGAGLSWICYHIFAYSYSIPKICSQCLKIPKSVWYKKVINIFLLISVTYGTIGFVIFTLDRPSFLFLSSGYLFATMLYLLCSYYMIRREIRATLSKQVQNLFKYFRNNINKYYYEKFINPKI